MSIFPKRTVPGASVTIHWNITLPAGTEEAVCPYVRIGIKTPDNQQHMLFEDHILLLPSTAAPAPAAISDTSELQYLNKHTPLLVLASYLAGSQSREKLVDILTNIQNGRHYYFTWRVPPQAPPGKYVLISEIHIDGSVKQSGTVAEDFFYVEHLNTSLQALNEAIIHNPGPEPVPAKLITYAAGKHQRPEAMEVFYIAPHEQRVLNTTGKSIFLVYNEERITVPLHTQQPRAVRNQQYLFLQKEQQSYLLPREGDNAWRLNDQQRELWLAAHGISSAASLRQAYPTAYNEMTVQGLITELL